MSKSSLPIIQATRARIQEIEEERAVLTEYLEKLTSLGRKEPLEPKPHRKAMKRQQHFSRRAREGRTKRAQILAAARAVLSEHGNPMHLNQLCDAIVARGVKIDSADPRNYLGVLLAGAKEEFVTERGVGWRLTDAKGPADGTAEPLHMNGAEAPG